MNNPFSLYQIKNPLLRAATKKISKLDVLEDYYNNWIESKSQKDSNTSEFLEYSLDVLKIKSDIENVELFSQVPKNQPFIFVANHPLGGAEGLLLTHILKKIRPDLKVLTNTLLTNIPEFKETFIGVDVLDPAKKKYNLRGISEISRHLSNNGALLIFPAGTVGHLKLLSKTVTDAPWSPIVSKLSKKYNAPVMPIFVGGRNKTSFYLSGYIHRLLRTLLLPRAMQRKKGITIPLSVGVPIAASDLIRLGSDIAATHYLRICCEILGNNTEDPIQDTIDVCELCDDILKDEVIKHVAFLDKYKLHENETFSLYCAPYSSLGPVMEQLSIERERTFREAGEGTGKARDSDEFDSYYRHLFLWNHHTSKIAGGYRLGKTDEIIDKAGLEGLYSHSLFDYNHQFLKGLGKTIEVGRSFITKEYQNNPIALDMLWKGIGHYVSRNPEYHTLFGCVSISRQYSKLVRVLLAETFVSHYGATNSLRRKVKARTPIENIKKPWTTEQLESLAEIPIINKLIGRIDSGKTIPVLIRHYLSLKGEFISFTVNTGFNETLDGLITVDLRKTSDRYLKRYMGKDGMNLFKSKWAKPEKGASQECSKTKINNY